jgi:hypothetical protein
MNDLVLIIGGADFSLLITLVSTWKHRKTDTWQAMKYIFIMGIFSILIDLAFFVHF